MKLMSFVVLVLIVALITAAVGGLGLLAVRASAASTQASLDLLRMHLRIAQLHEQLLKDSRDRLAAHAKALAPLAPESAEPALRRLVDRIDGGPPGEPETGGERP